MAQQIPNNKQASDLQPTRYTESRAPQFVGGNTDPASGNLIPGTKAGAGAGTVAGPEAPAPAQATTRLADVNADKPEGLGTTIGKAAIGAAAPYIGGEVGKSIGGEIGNGSTAYDAVAHTGENIGSVLGDPIKNALGSGAPAAAANSTTVPIGTTGGEGAAAAAGESALGSGVGGAAGAGLGTLIAGAAMSKGNFFENVAKPQVYQPAVGSAIGYGVGAALIPFLGPIAPFVGSFIGGMFCHAKGTMIVMYDGTPKAIEALRIGDKVMLGGAVIGTGQVIATDLFRYRGTIVNGRHAVFEDGRWLRVEDSPLAVAYTPTYVESCDPSYQVVYPIVTENHLLACEEYICADFAETGDLDMSASERLAKLNAASDLNQRLRVCERLMAEGFNAAAAA